MLDIPLQDGHDMSMESEVVSKRSVAFCLLVMVLLPLFGDRRDAYFENKPFYIEEIERDDGEISFDFSVPVNPESVTREKILVEGKPLPDSVSFFFNRRGDELVIRELPEWRGRVLSIAVKGVVSFHGQLMEPLSTFSLGPDDELEWDEIPQ